MRHLAALLEFLADIEKSLRFIGSLLCRSVLTLSRDQSVVRLHHRYYKATRGDLCLGPRHRFQRPRTTVGSQITHAKGFMNVSLADVFMNIVIGNEDGRVAVSAVALGVKSLIVVDNAGQQCRARLYFVLMRQALIGKRRV